MRVTVAGLWHLGTVTAAGCASVGHDVIGFDEDTGVIAGLQRGQLPVAEPGLAELTASAVSAGKLRFTSDLSDISDTEVLWVCYDTPVDDDDKADTAFVIDRISELVCAMKPGGLILISSQLPVGSTAQLGKRFPELLFACSPENLRLGQAIKVFLQPDRVVAGVGSQKARDILALLFAPITGKIEWMSVESAEMTKHAINAFLATSVAFINEIAGICEKTGADALEVERGLKTDLRIGAKAYLHPGSAFAGGTLARDIQFLLAAGASSHAPVNLFKGVLASNSAHKLWTQRRLFELLGDLKGKTVAILGLTYKPGTDTLRRSSSVEACMWLLEEEANVQAFDPAIRQLPDELKAVQLENDAEDALKDADAVLIATPWPEFQLLSSESFCKNMRHPVVLDPARHLANLLTDAAGIEYYSIGISK